MSILNPNFNKNSTKTKQFFTVYSKIFSFNNKLEENSYKSFDNKYFTQTRNTQNKLKVADIHNFYKNYLMNNDLLDKIDESQHAYIASLQNTKNIILKYLLSKVILGLKNPN